MLWVALSFLIIAGVLTVMVVVIGLFTNPKFINLEEDMQK